MTIKIQFNGFLSEMMISCRRDECAHRNSSQDFIKFNELKEKGIITLSQFTQCFQLPPKKKYKGFKEKKKHDF